MKLIERRIVEQKWFETEFSKTGWDSYGWFFKDDRNPMGESTWTVVKNLDTDKFYNPILGIAEKETDIL